MNNVSNKKLSLDRRVTYQIVVPGVIDAGWNEWEVKITVGHDADGDSLSTLTGNFDQAALQGLLRRLYSLDISLISVNWIDDQ
jgi:hypothetical protein